MQSECRLEAPTTPFEMFMGYDQMQKDYKKACMKLEAFVKQLAFSKKIGLGNGIMLIYSMLPHEKFDLIERN